MPASLTTRSESAVGGEPLSAAAASDALEDPLQDPLTVDHGLISDDTITYDKTVTELLGRPVTLKKGKTLYSARDKSSSKALGTFADGASISILEIPKRDVGRVWAKVKGTLEGGETAEGYINTRFAISGGAIAQGP
ncbi:MAG TPA: hypothetical protein PKA64_14640 [Myxococcota bacterium]|nr:hypothetical protein [Myxococcota bacterium]